MQLPVVSKSKGLMTEAEARRVGAAANRLANLRGAYTECEGGGTLTIRTKRNGNVSYSLSNADIAAMLLTLIEREAAFLTQMNIDVEDYHSALRT